MTPPPRRAGPVPAPVPDAEPGAGGAARRDADLTGPARPPAVSGPGRSAPDLPVAPGAGPDPEDGFVTFAHDSATLDPAAEEALSALLATRLGSGAGAGAGAEPVTVTLNGYASAEGDATYNRNLSAQRAAAVERWLVGRLPAGSEIRLVAHGETDAFGAAAANRRAGVSVTPRRSVPLAPRQDGRAPSVEVAPDGEGGTVPVDADAPAPAPSAAGGPEEAPPVVLPRLTLDPEWLAPRPDDVSRFLGPGWWQGQTGDPALSLLDPNSAYRGLRDRGAPIDRGWVTGVEGHFSFWFWHLHRDLGLRPDWAAWLANRGVALSVDREAAREHPTTVDLFNRERDIDHQLRGGWKTPILPLHPEIRFDITDILRRGSR